MADLPQELINEILLCSPVKSLLRFRCVCKSFCASIGSQSFINSHFKRSSDKRIQCKLIDLGVDTTDNDRPKIHALGFKDDFQPELILDKLHPSMLYPLFFSYCNGLVLLCILPCKLSIWNPSTRKYRILPVLPVKNTRILSFGLGYDSTIDDYKAVAIMSKKGWDSAVSQVWILELRSSRWRRILDFPYLDYNSFEDGGNGDCFVDGDLHFICHLRDEYESHIIVAFDVAKETFSVVDEPVYPIQVIPTRLSVFGGCLSISLWSLTTEARVDIYVRKKEGVVFTWTRLHSVTRQPFCGEAFERFADGRVAYSKEGDTAFLSLNGKLCSYDFEEKSLQEIVTKNTEHLDMFSFTESLVSVGS